MDYSVTWSDVVSRMEEYYGIGPRSSERYNIKEIRSYINKILDDCFEEAYKWDDFLKCSSK